MQTRLKNTKPQLSSPTKTKQNYEKLSYTTSQTTTSSDRKWN